MQQMSPMLQTYIEQKQEINNSNQNNNIQYIDLSTKSDTVELSTKKVENKKGKILKIVAISAAIVAAVAGGFVAAKKGLLGANLEKYANNLWNNITSIFKKTPIKSQTLQATNDTSQQTVENIKKFISNGSEIEGVKLEKGKAILADGEMFSGTMETVTKSGKKVAIDYENGLMTKSTINDKLFKTYEAPTKSLDRTKGTLIKQYDETGKKVKQSYHFYNDNGKISKTMNQNTLLGNNGCETGNYNVLEFSPNGKKIAEYETNEYYVIKEGKVFNDNGTVKKEFGKTDNGFKETTYLPDGKRMEKIGDRYKFNNDIEEQIATKELYRPKDIRFFNKDGKLDRRYYTHQFEGEASLTINPDDLSNEIKMNVPYSQKLGKKGDQKAFSVGLMRDMEGNEGQNQSIRILDDAIVNAKMNNDRLIRGFKKDELLSTVDELERGIKIAEDNGMLDVVNGDGCDISYERFRKYIQQLKDYAEKM